MLGDVIKDFINKHLDCEDCARAAEIPTKGMCCDSCGTEGRWSDELQSDFDQLIESHENYDKLKEANIKYYEDNCKLTTELQELKYQTSCKILDLENENKQLKEDALLMKAINSALKTYGGIDLCYYQTDNPDKYDLVMSYYDHMNEKTQISVLEWYEDQPKEEGR